MNLYTKIWLKLAPKGYVGVEKEPYHELLDGFKYWKSKCEYWIGESEEKARKIRELKKENSEIKGTNAYLFKALVNLREYYSISHSKQAVYNSLANQKEGE